MRKKTPHTHEDGTCCCPKMAICAEWPKCEQCECCEIKTVDTKGGGSVTLRSRALGQTSQDVLDAMNKGKRRLKCPPLDGGSNWWPEANGQA